MVGKTAPIREHDRERMENIHRYCGCLPCLIVGVSDRPTTIEHVTERGRRVGADEQHQWTIGLCGWHHFGQPLERWQHLAGNLGGATQATLGALGPSLAHGRHVFEEYFGDELKVLVPTQDYMLSLFDGDPWPEYALPRDIARRVRHRWQDLYAGPSRFSIQS